MSVKKPIDLSAEIQTDNTNFAIWRRNQTTNPAAVKPISGRQYQGTSPNPTYLLAKATAEFGPAGIGFGWEVEADGFQTFANNSVLHWCRIRFWHSGKTGGIGGFEEYGQTMASYTTNAGKLLVDDDAPKKSLTDAIVKALSRLGFAGDIFLGRWDDQKYVDQLSDQFGSAGAPIEPGPPPAQRRPANGNGKPPDEQRSAASERDPRPSNGATNGAKKPPPAPF